MKIGNVEIKGKALLAPMAGVSDKAFRELCTDWGAAGTTCEMISSKGLVMGDRKSGELAEKGEKEGVFAIQIFGNEPDIMAKSVSKVMEFSPDIIDINMGCPAPKIAGNGSGASLMRSPELAGKIIEAVVRESPVPVTVKIRAGWDENSINAVEIAKIAEQSGATAVTVHGRTKTQMYSPPVSLDIISRVKEAVKIPVIGNGDVSDECAAAIMLEKTNCDLLMVGRGALGRPWIFSQINAYLEYGRVIPEPPVSQKMSIMLRHIEKMCAYKGEYVGMREARKHAGWYTKGLRGAAAYRRELCEIDSMERLQEIAYKICCENENI